MTTLEAPKNPIVKPVIKPEQNIETVKKPAVTSEKPKTVEKSHSQGSGNHNSNKESFKEFFLKSQKNEKILYIRLNIQKFQMIKIQKISMKKVRLENKEIKVGKRKRKNKVGYKEEVRKNND